MTYPAESLGDNLSPQQMRNLLLRTADMPGADYRVLHYYLTSAPIGQPIRETAKDIAPLLKLSTTSMSRSIQRLRTGGWLEVSYRVGGVNFYRVGPELLRTATGHEPDKELATVSHLPVRSST